MSAGRLRREPAGDLDRTVGESVPGKVTAVDLAVRPAVRRSLLAQSMSREGGKKSNVFAAGGRWQVQTKVQMPVPTATAGLAPCVVTRARPAAPAPLCASADLSPSADGREQSCRPYQREILQPGSSSSHPCCACLVCSTGRPASMTTNEYNAPAD